MYLGGLIWEQPVVAGGVDLRAGGITPADLDAQGYFLWRGRWVKFDPDRMRRAGWFEWRDRWYPPLAGGALPILDLFITGTTQSIAVYDTRWSLGTTGDFRVNADTDDVETTLTGHCYWNADAFPDNQWVRCIFSVAGAAGNIGVYGRAATAARTGYYYTGRDTLRTFGKEESGAGTDFGVEAVNGFATSDTIEIQCSGSTITPLLNGSNDNGLDQAVPHTDPSPINSGSGGIRGTGTTSLTRIDNWEAGALAGGQPAMRRFGGVRYAASIGKGIF